MVRALLDAREGVVGGECGYDEEKQLTSNEVGLVSLANRPSSSSSSTFDSYEETHTDVRRKRPSIFRDCHSCSRV